MSEIRNYKVYKHTSPSGKVYIGITSTTVEKRWRNGKGYKGNKYFWRAINKYGWNNFKHEILFTGLTKEEAEQKEIELITLYDSTNLNKGYNILLGGDAFDGLSGQLNGMYGRTGELSPMYSKSCKDFMNEEDIKKWKENISKNHAHMTGGNNPNAKAVRNKTTGEVFPSCVEAGKKYNVTQSAIASSIRRVTKCCGFYWEFVDDPKDIDDIIKTVNKRQTGRKGKKVRNIETGEIFESAAKAEEIYKLSKSCISYAIRRNGKSGGYHWEYIDEEAS